SYCSELQCRIIDEADKNQPLVVAFHWQRSDADRDQPPFAFYVRSGDGATRRTFFGAPNYRSQLGAQSLARHRHHIPSILAGGNSQIAIQRAEIIEALAFSVDQDGGRRIGFEQGSP